MKYIERAAVLLAFALSTEAYAFVPKSFKAEYRQVIKKVVSGKEQETRGTISYLYPSRIRFEQLRPEKVVWVSNLKKSWFYQAPFIAGEPGQLKVTEGGKNIVGGLLDILDKGLSSNKYYKVSRNKKKVILTFNPKARRELDITKVELRFKSKEVFKGIASMNIFQESGKVVRLRFTNVKLNLQYSSELFVFVPPKNTKVAY